MQTEFVEESKGAQNQQAAPDISAEQHYQFALTMVKAKKDEALIRKILTQRGADLETIEAILERLPEEAKKMRAEEKRSHLTNGILWFAGGLILTVVTVSSALESGGVYFVAVGPMIYGGYRLIKGIS